MGFGRDARNSLVITHAWRPDDPWDPGNPQNRERTRVLSRELRTRLLAWDPVGVRDAPEAHDEYDCLISPLMHKLHDGVAETAIGDWLIRELTDHFGMSADDERERSLVAALVSWWRSATESPA